MNKAELLGQIALAQVEIMQEVKEGKLDGQETLMKLKAISKFSTRGKPLPVQLMVKGFQKMLLEYLQQHPDKLCTLEELRANIWGYQVSNSRIIQLLLELRDKLAVAEPIGTIEVIRGKGYRWSPL